MSNQLNSENAFQAFDFIINAHKNSSRVTVADTLCAMTAWRASGGRVAIIQSHSTNGAHHTAKPWVATLDGEYLTNGHSAVRRFSTAQQAAAAAQKQVDAIKRARSV